MIRKQALSALLSAALICSAGAYGTANAADTTAHTVTVYDFDGKVMATLSVNDGAALDLSGVDTSKLEQHLNVYTQIGFSSWSSYPAKITADTSVYALYKKMTISLDSKPKKTEYYSKEGNIDLGGLRVTITVNKQLPEKDEQGKFKVENEVINIESKCTTVPATLSEAFAAGKSAQVKVYPIDSEKEILTYDISYFPEIGDVDMNGAVNASDASEILKFYSLVSTGGTPEYKGDQQKRADIDKNGKVDSNDASIVLVYYSAASTGQDTNLDKLLAGKQKL
ncbi:MAG: dockerin type I domain-containing protein [Ruminococcus sp.]|nr:dockerin type I domain-containing protein [Ruminococcus sp.]